MQFFVLRAPALILAMPLPLLGGCGALSGLLGHDPQEQQYKQAETLPPLHLLLRVLGVRVISKTKVWTGGAFPWDRPVKVTHKGVAVERSAQGTRITFASKQIVELPPDAPWQGVVDRPVERALRKKSPPPKST